MCINFVHSTNAANHYATPTQLAQRRFHGLAISNIKSTKLKNIWKNFIKQQSKTVMV